MDKSKLARKMLEYEDKKKELDNLREEISLAVIERGESVTTGNVTFKYSKGRTTYDYEGSQNVWPEETVKNHTTETTVTKTDWRSVCITLLVEPKVKNVGEPSVSVKIEPNTAFKMDEAMRQLIGK